MTPVYVEDLVLVESFVAERLWFKFVYAFCWIELYSVFVLPLLEAEVGLWGYEVCVAD